MKIIFFKKIYYLNIFSKKKTVLKNKSYDTLLESVTAELTITVYILICITLQNIISILKL
jgi:hypothetical protein